MAMSSNVEGVYALIWRIRGGEGEERGGEGAVLPGLCRVDGGAQGAKAL
jgi:hypothetical protein